MFIALFTHVRTHARTHTHIHTRARASRYKEGCTGKVPTRVILTESDRRLLYCFAGPQAIVFF